MSLQLDRVLDRQRDQRVQVVRKRLRKRQRLRLPDRRPGRGTLRHLLDLLDLDCFLPLHAVLHGELLDFRATGYRLEYAALGLRLRRLRTGLPLANPDIVWVLSPRDEDVGGYA